MTAATAPRKPRKTPRKGVPRRQPGRPAGDGPDLREHMLDAAIACFARAGIAATSLRAIATEAAVTPALLHYYFGDKAQLQQAVVEERLMPAFSSLREPLVRAGDDAAALVAGFVRGIGALVARYPWLPALWGGCASRGNPCGIRDRNRCDCR